MDNKYAVLAAISEGTAPRVLLCDIASRQVHVATRFTVEQDTVVAYTGEFLKPVDIRWSKRDTANLVFSLTTGPLCDSLTLEEHPAGPGRTDEKGGLWLGDTHLGHLVTARAPTEGEFMGLWRLIRDGRTILRIFPDPQGEQQRTTPEPDKTGPTSSTQPAGEPPKRKVLGREVQSPADAGSAGKPAEQRPVPTRRQPDRPTDQPQDPRQQDAVRALLGLSDFLNAVSRPGPNDNDVRLHLAKLSAQLNTIQLEMRKGFETLNAESSSTGELRTWQSEVQVQQIHINKLKTDLEAKEAQVRVDLAGRLRSATLYLRQYSDIPADYSFKASARSPIAAALSTTSLSHEQVAEVEERLLAALDEPLSRAERLLKDLRLVRKALIEHGLMEEEVE